MRSAGPLRLLVASAIVIAAAAAAGVSPWLAAVTGESPVTTAGSSAGALMLAVVGGLILVRRPGNRIGTVFAVAGLLWSVGDACDNYARYVYEVRVEPLPGGLFAAWISEWFWIPWLFLVFVFMPLLFPTGRLPSRRWRPLVWVAGGTLALVTVLAMLESELGYSEADVLLRNPWGIPGHTDVEHGVFSLWLIVLFGSMPAALASLIIRYRGAASEERQQIRLVTYAASLTTLGFLLVALSDLLFESRPPLVESAMSVLVPLAAGLAILKHRLFDIDVVISKTVVFAGLAGFITAIYVGIVVGLGSLLGADDEPNLALSIVATAVVAVAFQPARERLTRLTNRLVFGRRATPYEVLSRFSAHLGDTVATDQTLERMARLLADGTGAAHAQVSLLIGGVMVPAASVGEVDAPAEAHTVQVQHQGETLGALSVTKKRGDALTPADVKLVDDLAAQAGLLLRNVRLTEELKQKIVDLRASRQRLVAAQDQERRRLERDLHDGAQQQIVALKLKLGVAKALAEREGAAKTVELVAQLAADTDEAVQTLRELAHGIYPPLLAAEGLPTALATAARRAAVPVTVEADGIGRYGADVEAAVYFCVLEAVTNAAKYAHATRVTVTLTETDGQLAFTVADDGDGFDPATTPTGHGITNMTDRLDALGGHLDIASAPGAGSVLRGRLPADVPERGEATALHRSPPSLTRPAPRANHAATPPM